MLQEILRDTLDGYPADAALATARNAVPDARLTLFASIDEARDAVCALAQPLPFSVIPIGHLNESLVGLDISVASIERQALPLLRECNGPWKSAGASVAALCDVPDGSLQSQTFDDAQRLADEAHQTGERDAEIRHLTDAIQRPLHTAMSVSEIKTVQNRIVAVAEESGFDAMGLRLASAGLDADAWRTIGAERAVANRVRDAVRALDGATRLGASLERVLTPLQRVFATGSWAWATRALQLHRAMIGEEK